jgi:hypothetical protein
MSNDYDRALCHLHRLHLLLEQTCSISIGAAGFAPFEDPTAHIERRLKELVDELGAQVLRALTDEAAP